MKNLSISWLVVWPQVINRILFIWGPMNSFFKAIKAKNENPRLQPLICFHYSFLGIYIYIHIIFGSFLKLSPNIKPPWMSIDIRYIKYNLKSRWAYYLL
jgi:hypothetical protein